MIYISSLFVTCFIGLVILTISHFVYRHFLEKRFGEINFIPVFIGLVCVVIVSPIWYEYKPLSSEAVQYRIWTNSIRDIVSYEKDATGFHYPFCASDRFVTIPKRITRQDVIKYSFGHRSTTSVGITLICDDCPKTFFNIKKKGAEDWIVVEVKKNFLSVLQLDFKSENKTEKDDTWLSQNFYEYVVKKAEEFSKTNPYGFRIEVDPVTVPSIELE
jgi:hypothetical protein